MRSKCLANLVNDYIACCCLLMPQSTGLPHVSHGMSSCAVHYGDI